MDSNGTGNESHGTEKVSHGDSLMSRRDLLKAGIAGAMLRTGLPQWFDSASARESGEVEPLKLGNIESIVRELVEGLNNSRNIVIPSFQLRWQQEVGSPLTALIASRVPQNDPPQSDPTGMRVSETDGRGIVVMNAQGEALNFYSFSEFVDYINHPDRTDLSVELCIIAHLRSTTPEIIETELKVTQTHFPLEVNDMMGATDGTLYTGAARIYGAGIGMRELFVVGVLPEETTEPATLFSAHSQVHSRILAEVLHPIKGETEYVINGHEWFKAKVITDELQKVFNTEEMPIDA